MESRAHIFLSYGRGDVYPKGTNNPVEQEKYFPIVEKVYHHLLGLREHLGAEAWLDKHCLTTDREFTDSIHQAVESSRYLLLFIGKHARQSPWCAREWKHALKHCVPVIPILLEDRWEDPEVVAAYPERIRKTDGINAQRPDGSLDEDYLLRRIVEKLAVQPAPLAIPLGAAKLPAHYIERQQYIDALKQRLAVNDRTAYAGKSPIVGLTSEQEVAALQGIGGIGKTTLALALCNECDVRRNFDHIFWLNVGPEREAEDVPSLMQIIGAHFNDSRENYDDIQKARIRLQKHLAGRRSLIVLDDVWAEGIVGAFSLAGVDARVLVTTRQKTLVEEPQSVSQLSGEESQRLLAAIFDPRNPQPESLNDDHRAILTALEGYTLAIEIAGGWLKKYGRSGEYLRRLGSGEEKLFENLQLSKSDKNANLERSLALSYNDLRPDDQQRFRALGMFAAGSRFSLEALDGVWELKEAFQEAQILVDAGLLETAGERYTLHPLLRAYARALLQRGGEMESLFPRYADFYITRATQFDQLQPEDWGQLDDDLADITQVGDELVRRTETGTTGDLKHASDFAHNIAHYLEYRRQVRRMEWLEMGLNAARGSGNVASESLFLNEIGLAWDMSGEKEKALNYYEKALPLLRAVGDQSGETSVLNNIGAVWDDLGDQHKALEYYEQALPLRRALGNKSGEAVTLNNIGLLWSELGEQRKALDYYEQALGLFRAVGNRMGEATTLNNIGLAWSGLGEKAKALEYYEQALPLRRAAGDGGGEAMTLNNIGKIWFNLGEKGKALAYYEQALPLYQMVGDRSGESVIYANMGAAYEALGDLPQAILYARRCVELEELIQHPRLTQHRAYLDDLVRRAGGG